MNVTFNNSTIFLEKLLRAFKKLSGAQKRQLLFWFWHFPQIALFQLYMWHPFKATTRHITVWSYILKMSASEGSESYCRDSFSSCSEHIDVWSKSGSNLEEEIFVEQSKNVIFAFESIGCLGETDSSRSPTNTNRRSDFSRLNWLEW